MFKGNVAVKRQNKGGEMVVLGNTAIIALDPGNFPASVGPHLLRLAPELRACGPGRHRGAFFEVFASNFPSRRPTQTSVPEV